MALTTYSMLQTVIFLAMFWGTVAAEGPIRLYGGTSDKEGVVQVNVAGEWKNLCDQEWDALDALVTCRQLGFTDGYAMVWEGSRSYYDSGTDSVPTMEPPENFPVEKNNVACNGTEQSLLSCRYKKDIPYCSNFASVACGITTTKFHELLTHSHYYISGDTFLISPTTTPDNTSGRVLFLEAGSSIYTQIRVAGGICNIDEQTASLICNSHGYSNGGKAIQVPMIKNFPMVFSELSCKTGFNFYDCYEEYTTDGICPNGVLANGVECYTTVRPSVIGALAFAGVSSVFIIIAGAFGIHWMRRKAKIPTSTTMSLSVGDQGDATASQSLHPSA
eukprot:XP_011683487.1 PREDICTED: deleted in malignant brain tumors 1 protein-like [Strongylocentrotus purpuratus]